MKCGVAPWSCKGKRCSLGLQKNLSKIIGQSTRRRSQIKWYEGQTLKGLPLLVRLSKVYENAVANLQSPTQMSPPLEARAICVYVSRIPLTIVRWLISASRGVAVSNHKYLSSSETRVNPAIRRWKLHLPESNRCQESIGGICLTKKLRAASLRPLTFSNHCSNAVFSMHFLA
jgi:hypothetical protein